jgi:outer membrane cobalamin receptor
MLRTLCGVAALAGAGLAVLAVPRIARADDPPPLPPASPPTPSSPSTPPSPPAADEPVDVLVHGDRTPPPPPRTGASVHVLTRPMLESLPGGDTQPLPNVLAAQPGFVNDTFGLLHTRSADGGVSYVIDGVPLLMIPLGQFANFIPMRMVQELKITTGGFPAEYGYGLGAVIDVTTRRAVGGPNGQAQIVYGSYQHVEPSFNYSQEIGRASVLVGGSFETTTRGLDAPAASPILHDDLLMGNGFTKFDYRLGERDRIEILATYMQAFYQVPIDPTLLPLSAAPPGAIRGPDAYGNVPPPFVPYNANPTESEHDVFVAVPYTHALSNTAKLLVSPYIHETHGDFLCDPAGSLGATADPGSTCANVQRDTFHAGASGNYSWKEGDHHEWKVGTLIDSAQGSDAYSSFVRNDALPSGGPNPALTRAGQDDTDALLAGVFGQDKMTFGKWTVFPGARLDMQHAIYAGTPEPSLFLAGPSGRLGASYAITDDLVVHAFAGYLWQPPIVLDGPAAARIIEPQLAGQVLPVDLKAETDYTGELGIADQLFKKVNVGLTGWGRITENQIDRQIVGNTNLYVTYNFQRGRAAGVEAWTTGAFHRFLDGFANVGLQMGQGQGTESEKFLFTAAQLADNSWVTLDHVQTWTINLGLDLHDENRTTHLSGHFNFGSGMRTGLDNTDHVPAYSTLDITLRHRFAIPLHPEVAIDVYNVFDEVYATRLGNGFIGSAYGALRHVDLRLTVPFSI